MNVKSKFDNRILKLKIAETLKFSNMKSIRNAVNYINVKGIDHINTILNNNDNLPVLKNISSLYYFIDSKTINNYVSSLEEKEFNKKKRGRENSKRKKKIKIKTFNSIEKKSYCVSEDQGYKSEDMPLDEDSVDTENYDLPKYVLNPKTNPNILNTNNKNDSANSNKIIESTFSKLIDGIDKSEFNLNNFFDDMNLIYSNNIKYIENYEKYIKKLNNQKKK